MEKRFSLPHSVSGLVLEVPVELRQPEHGLREKADETDCFDKRSEIAEEVHQNSTKNRQRHDAFDVGLE